MLLLPGFLAGRVFSLVAIQRRRSTLDTLGEIVLLEFLIVCTYGIGSDHLGWMPALVWPTPQDLESGTVDILRANGRALASLLGLAVLSGVALGWLHNLDQPLGLLRHLGITKQSTHATVWQATLYEYGRWVVVHLDSGDRIVGWPRQFSDTPEEGALFLSEAAFIGEDNDLSEIQGPGILLTRESRIRMIEFLDMR
ncbi:MAG: DUF6338 family protein [Planctomycetota bacterium]